MNDILKKYLPVEILEKIDNDELTFSERSDLLKKYNNILRILSTYIPQNIVLNKVDDINSKKHNGHFVKGTLMFADVNGFTALTEGLSKHGNEGAEEITRVLNSFFMVMIEIIFQYKGVLLKYGGDAMMIYFSSQEEFCGENHTHYALSAAMQMKEKMEDFATVSSKFGNFPLHISIAVHQDMFFENCVGNKSIHREYYLTGKGVETTAYLESVAGRDEILIHKNTYEQIKDKVTNFSEKDENILIEGYEIESLPPIKEALVGINYEDFTELFQVLDTLLPYVIRGVYEKVKVSWDRLILEGEHRPVAVMFLNFYATVDFYEELGENHESEIQKTLDEYFSQVQKVVHEYDGTINKIDMYDKGDKIVIIFGFPRNHSDDDKRAVRCAAKIIEVGKNFLSLEINKKKFAIHQKLGIHSGFIFCGNVGSPLRKEFTVMGDAVNLSARIMSSAKEEQVLISEVVYNQVKDAIEVKGPYQKKFKGKEKEENIYEVAGILKEKHEAVNFFIGRKNELKELENQFLHTNDDFMATQVLGPIGVGKTSLLKEFLKIAQPHTQILLGKGIPYGNNMQYHAIKDILKVVMDVNDTDDEIQIKEKIDAFIKVNQLENIQFSMPLVGVFFSEQYEKYPVFDIENPIEKKELLHHALCNILKILGQKKRVLIVIEDAEWLDYNSLDFLNYLIESKTSGIMLLVLTRKDLFAYKKLTLLELKDLTATETASFIDEYPDVKNVPVEVKETIFEKSKGNPYFIHEILSSIRDFGKSKDLPESIHKSVLSRMDVLPELSRELLQVAAVIGNEFSSMFLKKIAPHFEKDIDMLLKILEEGDFVQKQGSHFFNFRNMLVQEVAYNSISVRRKKSLHLKIASLMEERDALSANLEMIAYHYENSEIYLKALYYYEKSGDKAFSLNNYQKAMKYYQVVSELFKKVEKNSDLNKVEVNLYKKIGKILFIAGKNENALDIFQKALDIAKEEKFNEDIADISLEKGLVYSHSGKYHQAIDFFNQASTIYEAEKMCEDFASCNMNIGLVYKQIGKSENAARHYKKALEVYKESEEIKGIADIYNNLGNLSKALFKYDEALNYYEKAKEFYEKKYDEIGLSAVYNNIGTLHNHNGNIKTALEFFNKSIQIETQIGNRRGLAITYNNLGNTYIFSKDWVNADSYFQKAFEIADKLQDVKMVADIYLNRGVLYMYQDDFEQSLSYLKNSLDLHITLEDEFGQYTTLYNIALLYEKEKLLEIAISYFEKAYQVSNKLSFRLVLEAAIYGAKLLLKTNEAKKAKNLLLEVKPKIDELSGKENYIKENYIDLLANVELKLENYDQAILLYLDLIEMNKNTKSSSYNRLKLAFIYQVKGDTQFATEQYEIAHKHFEKNKDTVGLLFTLNKLGSFYYSMKDYSKALDYFEQCAQIMSSIHFEFGESKLYRNIGILYSKVGEHREAIRSFDKAINIEENVKSHASLAETYLLLGLIYYQKEQYEKCIEAFTNGLKQDKKSKLKAFYFLGNCYFKIGKTDEAIHHLEYCSNSSERKIAHNSLKILATIYEKSKQYHKLKNILKRMVMIEDDSDAKKRIKKYINMLN